MFRLLMIILGFYVSYYLLLLSLTEFEIYKSDLVSHQVGLFFGSLFLGLIISMTCYMFDKINFLVFGVSIGCSLSVFVA